MSAGSALHQSPASTSSTPQSSSTHGNTPIAPAQQKYIQPSTSIASGSGQRRPMEFFKVSKSSANELSSVEGRKKRRKVAKACLTCQKSHLTCDALRPCTRCVKKGIGDSCVEGVRKKAKYLLDPEDRGQSSQAGSASPPPPISTTILPSPQDPTRTYNHDQTQQFFPLNDIPNLTSLSDLSQPLNSSSDPSFNPFPINPPITEPSGGEKTDIWLAPPLERGFSGDGEGILDGKGVGNGELGVGTGDDAFWGSLNIGTSPFTSAAANMEYEMLDQMFGAMSPVFNGGYANWELPNPIPDQPLDMGIAGIDQGRNSISETWQPWTNDNDQSLGEAIASEIEPAPVIMPIPNKDTSQTIPAVDDQNAFRVEEDGSIKKEKAPEIPRSDPPLVQLDSAQKHSLFPSGGLAMTKTRSRGLTPSEVYRTVLAPYDYTEGYHFLMKYLTENFEQTDVLRVVRSLATFRPSLIALQMPMSEEDEVFLERAFQRTLIELEKLISYSATPTAVWRRTGEICFASSEFCALVGQSEESLLAGKTYIYQLFERASVIAYWENFSVHAFENTTQNFFQPISLKMGDEEILNCTCCFTIRRDVFDLPSVVIGQFLPVPEG